MLPELVGLAEQLGKLHESGLVHQAVHQRFVLVGQQGDWKLARLEKAAPMNSSLYDSMYALSYSCCMHLRTKRPCMDTASAEALLNW